jgi:hypothetical protein
MKSSLRNLVVFLLSASVALPVAAKKKHEDPLATINFLVIRDENGRPVRNAAVVLHPVDEHNKQERSGLELKTNPEGKVSYDGIPYGRLRVQVLAHGFQTYGEDFEISQPSLDITVKLKRPGGQYSIYESHPGDKSDEAQPDPGKPRQ